MPDTFTANKNLIQPATGSYNDAWGPVLNNEVFEPIDNAFGGSATVSVTGVTAGTYTLTLAQYQPPNIIFTGVLSANVGYIFPTGVGGIWTVYNNTTGAFTLQIGCFAQGLALTLAQGKRVMIVCDALTVQIASSPIPSANPSVLVGIGAKDGTAETYMTSDSAPGLDLSISPTWTGSHTFDNLVTMINGASLANTMTLTASGVINANAGALECATQGVLSANNFVANTAYVDTYYVRANSGAFTGNPTCPTQSPGNNSSFIANTAFVQAAIAGAGSVSLTNPGYVVFATGFVVQWGVSSFSSSGSAVNFPIAFPNACLWSIANAYGSLANAYVQTTSATQITAVNGINSTNSWLAIGH